MLNPMQADAQVALGGVGLFLFGMILLTGGLRHLTALRQLLVRFTSTPLRGAAAGSTAFDGFIASPTTYGAFFIICAGPRRRHQLTPKPPTGGLISMSIEAC